MGFFINEITYELKQHLNLSESAWEIIYNDISSFYGEEGKQSFSGFLNRVFYNFYQDAGASVSLRAQRLREELLELAKREKDILGDEKSAEPILSLLVSEYEKQALSTALSYPKGIGKKFRVNRQNLDVLRDIDCADMYSDSIGSYMKAIFEEYATLPQAKRESIFFKETIDLCNLAIARRNKLKITLAGRFSTQKKESYARKFYLSPYAIVTDKSGFFNYLIGISEEIRKDGSLDERHISSFRISRIDKISIMSSMSGFLSRQKIDEIENELQTKSPQYMAGDLEEIKVLFTDKGLELFERQMYLRPAIYTKIDKNCYLFRCTEMQAVHYFFKLGRDARIISPIHLRERLRGYYKDALAAYEEDFK